MAAAGSLPALLAEFDRNARLYEQEMADARRALQEAEERVTIRRSEIDRLNREIAAARARVQAASGEDSEATRADRQRRLDALEQQLIELNSRLFDEQSRLNALQNERREDVAQQKLEQERGRLLVQCRTMVRALNDDVVRFQLATAALEGFAARGITPEKFRNVSDHATAQEILSEFTKLRDSATDTQRAEAERYDRIRNLLDAVAASRTSFLAASAQTERSRGSLTARRTELQQAIAALEAPEPAERTQRRTTLARILFGAGIAAIVIALAMVAIGRGGLPGYAYLIAAALIAGGLAALHFGWQQTDHYRTWKLSRLGAALQSTEQELRYVEETAKARLDQARNEVDRLEGELTRLAGEAGQPPLAFDESDPFKAPLDAAQRLYVLWREQHPEIVRVLP
jgi:chromosome segregation ATPase